MKFLMMIVALGLSMPALSVTTYKCSKDDVVSYQSKPCSDLTKQTVIADKPMQKEEIDSGGTLNNGISIGEFSIKPDHIDSTNGQWFIYKVTVTNTSNTEQKVYLTYKAVDYQGFKIVSENLSGTIPANSSVTLTDDSYLEISKYQKIEKWILNK